MEKIKKIKVIFTGGGTAGHLYPLLAIIQELKKIDTSKKLDCYYIGPKDDFTDEVLLPEGIKIVKVSAGKIRRYFSLANITDLLFKIPVGVAQAFSKIYFLAPDVIFSKGGYGSLPAVIAGKLLATPIFLHESDKVPGMANKLSARFAAEIFSSFPLEKKDNIPVEKVIVVGNPVRSEILEGSAEGGRATFDLSGTKPVILITGGSQGARAINEKVLAVLSEYLEEFEIIHQTGKQNFEQVEIQSRITVSEDLFEYYHPVPFLSADELADAYAASDIVISRAGSGSIFELAVCAKPGILIPLPGSAQNHQERNAKAYEEAGAGIVINNDEFTPKFLLEKTRELLRDKSRLLEMSEKAREFAKPGAARIIAEYLYAYLTQEKKK